METQVGKGEEDERVNINISHNGLADGLRSLAKTKIMVKTMAQSERGGPSLVAEKTQRDVTNKMEPGFSGSMPIRIITKQSLGQKRPSKSPYEKPRIARQVASGPGRGRPPDLPSINSTSEFTSNHGRRNVHLNLGEALRSRWRSMRVKV